jgi:Asp/Glu/hydantoin racemase
VRFSDHIISNIRNRITIPVNFSARKAIKSEASKALYNRVDSILAKTDRYEKTATNLVHDLNLKASRYQYKSQRYQLLKLLHKNLDGVALSSVNANLCMKIVECNNKQDWK